MPESLRQKQSRFAMLIARLLLEAERQGYEVTMGEGYRSPEEAQRLAAASKGIVNSLHTIRLAHDINLFRDGVYLTATEAYRPLGEWWEAEGGAWGGRFTRADGNHFSLAHDGRK